MFIISMCVKNDYKYMCMSKVFVFQSYRPGSDMLRSHAGAASRAEHEATVY